MIFFPDHYVAKQNCIFCIIGKQMKFHENCVRVYAVCMCVSVCMLYITGTGVVRKKTVTVTLHPMDIVSLQVSRIFRSKYIAKYDVDNLLDNFPEN